MSPDNSHFGLTGFLQQLEHNPIAFTIFAILLLMSILSWYIIVSKMLKLAWLRWHNHREQRRFWQQAQLATVGNELAKRGHTALFARLRQAALTAHLHYQYAKPEYNRNKCSHSEFMTRTLQHQLDDERQRLQSGLSLLASIGSTAPFIGLLGTVLGIYHALLSISAQGQASLATVAGPVGEALVMTAIGLAVAIPAVLGYNLLNRANRHLLHQLKTAAHELHNFFHLGIIPQQQPPTAVTEEVAAHGV